MSSLPVFARKKEAAGDKTVQRLVTASDCDDLSLVSYNSVRDRNPSAAPKTALTSVRTSWLIDPIDKVRQFNTQLRGRDIAVSLERGFPTLLSDSSFFSHSDHRSSTVVTANADPFVKLPVLGNTDGKHGNSKTENGSSSENNSNEPRPVFIIPFGAFDDPVEK